MARNISLGRLFWELEAETKGLHKGLGDAERALGRTTRFIRAHPVAALGAMGTAALAAGIQVTRMAAQVDTGLRKIAGALPGAINRMGELRKEVRNLSVDFGISQTEITRIMHSVAANGARTVEELKATTRAAVVAGTATGEDFQTIVSGLSQVLDIFGIAGTESERVLAKLFVTAQGKTSITELLGVMEKLAPFAKQSGIGFETLAAAVATLIGEGFQAKKIVTELGDVLEKKGAAGIQELARQSRVASDGIKELREQMTRMQNTPEGRGAILKETFNARLIDLGNVILPTVNAGMGLLVSLFESFEDRARRARPRIADLLTDIVKLTGDAREKGFKQLIGDLAKLGGDPGLVAFRDHVQKLATEDLVLLQRGYAAAINSGLFDEQKVNTFGRALRFVNTEIRKRPPPPAAPAPGPLGRTGTGEPRVVEPDKALQKELERDLKLLTDRQELVRRIQLGLAQPTEALLIATAEAAFEKLREELLLTGAAAEEVDRFLAPIALRLKAIRDAQANEEARRAREDSARRAQEMAEGLADAVQAARNLNLPLLRTKATVQEIARGILQVAESFGIATGEVHRLLDGIDQIIESGIVDLGGNFDLSFDNIIGALSGTGSILSAFTSLTKSLFGESPAQRAMRAAIQELTVKLEQHRKTIGDLIEIQTPGNKVAALERALEDFFATGGRKGTGGLRGALEDQGLTFEDFKAIAADFGIDVGKVGSGKAAELLREDIRARNAGFEESFGGQRDRLQARHDVTGATPEQRLKDLIELATGQFGSPEIARALGGLDLSTPEGRAAAIQKILSLLDLQNPDLGGMNLQQFRDTLIEIATLLNQIGSASSGGFSVSPVGGTSVSGLSAGTVSMSGVSALPPPVTVSAPSVPASPGGATLQPPAGSTVIEIGPVVIQAPSADPAALGDAFVERIAEQLGNIFRRTELARGIVVRTI